MELASSCVQSNSPIMFFLVFHRSMSNQLGELHRLMVSHLNGEELVNNNIQSILEQFKFLGLVYKQHLNAKDEVINSALYNRMKNLVQGHLRQRDLYDHISEILNSITLKSDIFQCPEEFLSLAKTLKQFITQNMAEEEEQVFPMLVTNFSIENQASLVWKYLYEIPTNLLAKVLSTMSSSLSDHEYKDLLECFRTITIFAPEEKLLQPVIFNWIEREGSDEYDSKLSISPIESVNYKSERVLSHPIDDTLLWHKAIKKELNETFGKIKNMCLSGDYQNQQDFDERLKFITEVCLFHSIGRDKVIFPSIYGEASQFNHHGEQQIRLDEIRDLLRNSRKESHSSAEFYSKLCFSVDQVMETIGRHLYIEESQVLTIIRENFSIEKQRALLHQSLCLMPLRLIRIVLPWLVGTMNDKEAKTFFDNMNLSGADSDYGLAKLFCNWAFNEDSSSFTCIKEPIDIILKVQKAIRRDIESLSIKSQRIRDCDEAFLHHFIGRFCLLWGLYKSHSNSKENIIYPAILSKAESNHELHERLFEEIFRLLSELSHQKSDRRLFHKLSSDIQSRFESIRISIDEQTLREEKEVWPFLRSRFSTEEQEKMIGYVLGTTTAESLRLLLPWLSSSLTQKDQRKLMEILKRVTKNTMFEEWLVDCSKEDSLAVSHKVLFRSDSLLRPRKNDRKEFCQTRNKKLLQKYMASRWMAAQKRLPNSCESLIGRSESFRDHKKKAFGCEHYKRNCKLRATCCGELFPCRFCHDNMSDHSMDRKATSEMMCMRCLKVQPIGPICNTPSCNGFSMAKYYCKICKLFDDERNIYHCPYCNICRVGLGLGVDYFHCMSCNCCMSIRILDHKCKQKCLETSCPVCDEFMFTSVKPIKALRCGHCIHSTCLQECESSPCKCLICTQSSVDTMSLAKSSALVVGLDHYKEIKPYSHIENGRETEVPSWPSNTSEKTTVFGFAKFWEERLYPFLVWLRISSFNNRKDRTITKEIFYRSNKESVFMCCFVLCYFVVFCVMISLALLLCLELVGRDNFIFP